MVKNQKIRNLFKARGVYQWEVAEQLGVSEMTLIRWLRQPLNENKENQITAAAEKAYMVKQEQLAELTEVQ